MNELVVSPFHTSGELARLIHKAADSLILATTAAEVLEARDQASFAYDAAKSAARLAKAKGAHDEIIAQIHRTQADALEIEAGAKRRLADEYDAAQDRGEIAGHGGKRGNQHANVGGDNVATAADIGLSRPQVFEARQIRDAIENDPGALRRVLDELLDAGEEPTKAKLRRELAPAITKIRAHATAEKKERRVAKEIALASKIEALPNKRFGVILADPEWRFEPYSRDSGMDRAPDNHYPTSDTDDIAARDVASIAADDCVLFLWATAPMLLDAIRVMADWGFAYKTHVIWAKERMGDGRGTGYWFLGEHELLLVGVKGDVPCPAMGTQWRSVITARVGEHSAKPEVFLELIEDYFPNLPKIELNRRGAARPGWGAWGAEAVQTEGASEADTEQDLPLPTDDELTEYKILAAIDGGMGVSGPGLDELLERGSVIFGDDGIELSFDGEARLKELDCIIKAASDGDAVRCQPKEQPASADLFKRVREFMGRVDKPTVASLVSEFGVTYDGACALFDRVIDERADKPKKPAKGQRPAPPETGTDAPSRPEEPTERVNTDVAVAGLGKSNYAKFSVFKVDGKFRVGISYWVGFTGFTGAGGPPAGDFESFDDALRSGFARLREAFDGVVGSTSSTCASAHKAAARRGIKWLDGQAATWGLAAPDADNVPVAKPEKLTPYERKRQEAAERRMPYRMMLSVSCDTDELLLQKAWLDLAAYNLAVHQADVEGMTIAAERLEAIGEHLFGLPLDYDWTTSNGPPKGSDRFSCLSDARFWLMAQLAAPDGDVPMFGQKGRFVIDLFGCRVDFRYSGLFGICGGDAHVIDLDRPYFSETGYRSFQVCPADHVIHAGGLDCKGYVERVCTAQSTEGGKRKIKLKDGPFGLTFYKGDERFPATNDAILDDRKDDPAYQPGGHLFALLAAEGGEG